MAKKEIINAVNLTITTPRQYLVTIKGVAPLLMNKLPDLSTPKGKRSNQAKEDPAEVEERTWREKLHFDSEGQVYIPGENSHENLKGAASYWNQKIPGEGNKTYTDVFARGVICENLYLGLHKDDQKNILPFGKMVNGTPSKGKKSGCKVYKIRPQIPVWGGTFKIHVFDARLYSEIIRVVMTYGGIYIGHCDWRPVYGRFDLVSLEEIK